jgi:predicted HAD superfamily hydrolase
MNFEKYSNLYPDVKISGISPEKHYKTIGKKLNRNIEECSLEKNEKKSEYLCIVIHAYYVDIFEEILEKISKLENKYKLYVCHNKEQKEKINYLLENYKIKNYEAISCINKGRNFGPMLVEFREKIMNHDYLLHIHTKKSLRTGEDQKKWRESIYDNLFGNSIIVDKIIESFQENNSIGLIGPCTINATEVSYWYYNWLSIGHLLKGFFNRIGINKYQKNGFINFPIGGMFWCRTIAMRQLFEYEWKYEYFEDEPLPDDGTLPHVIERSLGEITKFNGYSYREAMAENGKVIIKECSNKIDEYYFYMNNINNIIDTNTVSFDFFDTIFCRNCLSPGDIHEKVGYILKNTHNFENGYDFSAIRKNAESRARDFSINGECDYDEIYNEFENVSNWSFDHIKKSKELELELELKFLVPRIEVVDLIKNLKKSNKKIIIVSDIYLKIDFIREVLDKHGILCYFDKIYLSSEVRLRKDWGNIWNHISEKEDVSSLIHIGDNHQSDVQQPLRSGIRSLGLLNTAITYNKKGIELPNSWEYSSTDWRSGLVIGPCVSKFGNSPFINRESNVISSFSDLGYIVYGPIVYVFLSWLFRIIKTKKYSSINFASRDSYWLMYFYKKINKFYAMDFPDPNYLLCSRQSLLSCAVDDDIVVEWSLNNGSFNSSVGEWFIQRTGFNLQNIDFVLHNSNYSKENVLNVFKKYSNEINSFCQKNKNDLIGYLDKINFWDDKSPLLVDLGFAGTSQKLLNRITGKNVVGAYFSVNEKIHEDIISKCSFHNCFDNSGNSLYIAYYSMLLETVFTSFHPRVTSFKSEHIIEYNKSLENSNVNSNKNYSDEIMQGVSSYIDQIINNTSQNFLLESHDNEVAVLAFKSMIKGSLKLSDDILKTLFVDDDFSGNGILNPFDIYGITSSRI